ncbi:hypothetical protein B0H16DRAFT_1457216 [Mycena metata]|uniref:Uncharacterized protein n=1 Tax=Mycena metata TaxID=1033252 RepID=A0AAD7J8T4_9AGAR|nr:hypothetical protein B0H16DRAFT_1457216 [Mycena metata]
MYHPPTSTIDLREFDFSHVHFIEGEEDRGPDANERGRNGKEARTSKRTEDKRVLLIARVDICFTHRDPARAVGGTLNYTYIGIKAKQELATIRGSGLGCGNIYTYIAEEGLGVCTLRRRSAACRTWSSGAAAAAAAAAAAIAVVAWGAWRRHYGRAGRGSRVVMMQAGAGWWRHRVGLDAIGHPEDRQDVSARWGFVR